MIGFNLIRRKKQMEKLTEINGVKIGDVFKTGQKIKAIVVDFHVVTSMKTGELVGYKCIAKGLNTMALNEFETPFSTVVRNKTIDNATHQNQ